MANSDRVAFGAAENLKDHRSAWAVLKFIMR